MPKSISVSRAKTFKSPCKLQYYYTYIKKFEPVVPQPIEVTAKGLVLHQVFENLLKFENYENEVPLTADNLSKRKTVDEAFIMATLKTAMKENQLSIETAEKYNIKKGIKRWLSFKHDYLDKRNHQLFAEKRYDEILFDEVKTTSILDLLEDNGDGTFTIYDYKTPAKANTSLYKDQLITYAYMMACVKGLIKPGSEDYGVVATNFKLFVFFPIIEGEHEDYKDSLKQVKFKTEDVKRVIEELKHTCEDIDGFDWNKPAEALQPPSMDFKCNWCTFRGAKPQPEIGFEGCPISCFTGFVQTSLFKPVEYHH